MCISVLKEVLVRFRLLVRPHAGVSSSLSDDFVGEGYSIFAASRVSMSFITRFS